VLVYGTNPSLTPLLKINPFSFPAGIHILEHLDRLVELFNVCWPMYAAMPAVLKSAVEKSYQDCGWDLMRSQNKYGEMLYPSFVDVAYNIKEIIDKSEFDTDNKGAYKGSLLTRLESLTNGINGMIFTCDEISNEDLFDKNVIVDLSRVGSSETKSLIMGMLVLKLQEYRMISNEMNVDFRHLTVLEEAHNLLKRTSTEQSSESANLLGKSVEMLSNAIAEMRTYGEGFIIADQAPGLMDMSVIRNTNTKIIMRLPDQTDRELVGKAANLNEDQIKELAKLPCGVAAIYQNEWVQPVLCKVDRFTANDKRYTFTPDNDVYLDAEVKTVSESLLDCIMDKELFRKSNKRDISLLKSRVIKSKLSTKVKLDLIDYVKCSTDEEFDMLRTLLYDFLAARNAIELSRYNADINAFINEIVEQLQPSIKDYSKKQIDIVLSLVLYEQAVRDNRFVDLFCRFSEILEENGGVY
jgi:ATP-binding protein